MGGGRGLAGRREREAGRERDERTNPVGAQLELHVNVAFVLEAVLKGDDVGVLHCLVDLDLAKELAALKVVSQLRAGDAFLVGAKKDTDLALILGTLELLFGDDF